MIRSILSCTALALLILCSSVSSGDNEIAPEVVFSSYLQAMVAGDWKEVEKYWHKEEIAASHRLGIVYDDVPVKIECASPLFTHQDDIRSGEIEISSRITEDNDESAYLQVTMKTKRDSLETGYILIRADDGWKFQSKLVKITQAWQSLETKYFELFYQYPAMLNEIALDSLDNFVDYFGKEFNINNDRMSDLHTMKIPYYLCSEQDIVEITGFKCQGMVDLAHDAIISRQLPHYHELVHLLINYALGEVPLYTQPFLQEGLAVCYGGRWGKSPEVILQMGQFILTNNFFELQDLLIYNGFHRKIGRPDLSYPVAGMLVRHLIEEFGINRLKTLYLHLSGTNNFVTSRTYQTVKAEIEELYGIKWEEITSGLQNYSRQYIYSGIIPGGEIPAGDPARMLDSDSLTVRIWNTQEFSQFEIISTSRQPEGVILIKLDELKNEKYKSWVFEDQLPDTEYRGEVYGIYFTTTEAGLYHYPTNNLLAKYVYSFQPDEQYWNEASKTLKLKLDRAKIRNHLEAYDLYVNDK